jgi:beta-lactamase class A
MPSSVLQGFVEDAVSRTSNIAWSVCIRNGQGHELACFNHAASMEIASVGKLLLLIEVARQCEIGDLAGGEVLLRDPALVVADSGIWQHLRTDRLPVHDLCILIASVSDNLATNILLKRIGFEKLDELRVALGLTSTALLDYVREERGPDDVPTLATGSAAELSSLMSDIAMNKLISQAVSEQLRTWLATGVDLSMVLSAFNFDPLAHAGPDRGYSVHNKTGTDTGIRADAGTVCRNSKPLSYAVIANWEPCDLGLRDTVLATMNAIGKGLRDLPDSTA